jgi:PAS domain-containing protein
MIQNTDRTQLLGRPSWESPRIHLLNDIWLLTIVAIVVATGLPWFANDYDVDLGTASVGLLALGAIHVAFSLLATSFAHARWHSRALTLFHTAGVLLLAFIWSHVGALQNPLFLLVFVLPVFGAIFLSRWQPYVVAGVSIAAVGGVALSQAPELRWYARALLGTDAPLTSLLGHPSTAAPASFTGFYAPSSYLLVLLEVFAVLLIACAVAAEYVGLIVERLNGHALIARSEAQRSQELWAALIEQLPIPVLLVVPATLTVVSASASTRACLGGDDQPLEGRPLFEILHCTYPETVQTLLKGADGEAPTTVIRVGDELRLACVRVLHVTHKEQRLALLTVHDVTDVFCLKAALDTSEYAALVTDSRGRVMVYNERAAGLFGMTRAGVPAADLLPQAESGPIWWEAGLTGRRKLHVQIGTRVYQITSSAVRFPGETDPLYAVSILPVAEGTPSDTPASGATTIMNALRLR